MAIEAVFDGFQDALGVDVVTFAGPRQVDETAKPPRITWKPIADKLRAPVRLGGNAGDDGAILSRHWAIQVDIWGTDLANTEFLADLFLATAHDLLSQFSYQPGDSTWKATGQAGDGAICSMSIFILAPVLRNAHPTATLGSIKATFRLPTDPDVVSEFTKP